jgi:hypothetical protein
LPTWRRDDDTPVVEFNPQIEVSPFTLFRLLRGGEAPLLVDARSRPGPLTLRGALPLPGPDWQPPEDRDVVLFDDDGGGEALELVRRLRAAGRERVKVLFGGLDLYEFSLDPEVVGSETFLERR